MKEQPLQDLMVHTLALRQTCLGNLLKMPPEQRNHIFLCGKDMLNKMMDNCKDEQDEGDTGLEWAACANFLAIGLAVASLDVRFNKDAAAGQEQVVWGWEKFKGRG